MALDLGLCLMLVGTPFGVSASRADLGKIAQVEHFQRLTYHFSVKTTGQSELVELKQAPTSYRSALVGELTLIGSGSEDRVLGWVEIQSLSLTSGQYRMSGAEEALLKLLNQPFLVSSKRGKIQGVVFHSGTPSEVRKTIRTLLSVAQLPTPSLRTQVLDDVVGSKQVTVKLGAYGDLTWKPIRYLAHTGNLTSSTVSGTWKAKYDNKTFWRIISVTGEEHVKARVTASSNSDTTIQSTLTLERVRNLATADQAVASSQMQTLRAEPVEPLWTRPTEADSRRALAKHTLRNLTRDDVMRIVDDLGTSSQSDQTGTDAFSKLRALYILDDQAAIMGAAKLNRLDPKSPRFIAYSQALVSAGTPTCQQGFLQVLEARRKDPVACERLIVQLVGLEHPTRESLKKLMAFASSTDSPTLASSSVLILGRFANRLAQSNPDLGHMIVTHLGKQLTEYKNSGKQSLYLGALGNAGQIQCLRYIKPFLTSMNGGLRSEAVRAIRFISGNEIDQVLRSKLSTDGSDDVRESAVFALGFRSYNSDNFGSEIVAMRSDKSDRVRMAALNLLWGMRDSQPAIVSLIQDVSQRDPSKEIRKHAADLLSSQ